jgi:hypothetical protein
VCIHFHHTVTLRVVNFVAKHGGAVLLEGCTGEPIRQPMPVKNIVAQYQGNSVVTDEVAANQKRLGDTFGTWLRRITDRDAKPRSVAQNFTVAVNVLRRTDEKNVADLRQH